eukprot:554381-Alexandrium_andersonii.AAC.1
MPLSNWLSQEDGAAALLETPPVRWLRGAPAYSTELPRLQWLQAVSSADAATCKTSWWDSEGAPLE